MLTVTVRPPRTADVLRKNPLGLYVEAIDWSREYERDRKAIAVSEAATTPPAPVAPSSPAIQGPEGAQP